MKSSKKLKHLRFPHFRAIFLNVSLLLTVLIVRLFGCADAKDQSRHSDETKAQNGVTRAKNSKFALAVIQTLLDTSKLGHNFFPYLLPALFSLSSTKSLPIGASIMSSGQPLAPHPLHTYFLVKKKRRRRERSQKGKTTQTQFF